MRRRQCLSPLPPPALIAMMMYYQFRSYHIFGGAQSSGSKIPREHVTCYQVFLQSQKKTFSVIEFPEERYLLSRVGKSNLLYDMQSYHNTAFWDSIWTKKEARSAQWVHNGEMTGHM